MVDRVLNWLDFGTAGTAIGNGSSVDTGGVAVTVGFQAQDHGATLATSTDHQYVASGESFSSSEGARLYGLGGEGGIDNTSTTTLTFDSTNSLYSDQVSNVSFRINDIDRGTYEDNHIDIVTIRAFDANGNPVQVTLTPVNAHQLDVDGNTATGITSDDGTVGPNDSFVSLLVEIDGPVERIEIDYDNGQTTDQAIWLTDVHFSTIDAQDGVVDGTAGNDLIDIAYLDDPEGDRIDNNDALLPGEAPQDDIVDAREGNDVIKGAWARMTSMAVPVRTPPLAAPATT